MVLIVLQSGDPKFIYSSISCSRDVLMKGKVAKAETGPQQKVLTSGGFGFAIKQFLKYGSVLIKDPVHL